MTLLYDLGLNIIAEIIGLILSIIAIYLIVERLLEKYKEKEYKKRNIGIFKHFLEDSGLITGTIRNIPEYSKGKDYYKNLKDHREDAYKIRSKIKENLLMYLTFFSLEQQECILELTHKIDYHIFSCDHLLKTKDKDLVDEVNNTWTDVRNAGAKAVEIFREYIERYDIEIHI